jgi:c-di-GMP-binding flagellar brake protein YcgR
MTPPQSQARRIIELRQHPRIAAPSGALLSFKRLVVPVQFNLDTEGDGALINLSLGGCQLRSDVALNVSERYNLILQVFSESAPMIVEAAIVRWARDNNYGVKFTSLPPASEERLHELLQEIRRSER